MSSPRGELFTLALDSLKKLDDETSAWKGRDGE